MFDRDMSRTELKHARIQSWSKCLCISREDYSVWKLLIIGEVGSRRGVMYGCGNCTIANKGEGIGSMAKG